jgi:hypothetical protein
VSDLTREQRNRAAVHKAMEIIVENEITGVSEWRYNLTDRLTEAALSALRAATPGDGLGEAVTALSDAIEGSWPDFLRSAPAEHLAQARQGSVRTARRLLDWLLAHAAERQAVVEYLLSGERTHD